MHIGRPDIKPERETRMPVVKEIPRAKEPPQRIREVKVKELKKERPMVKDKNRSVFSPNAPEKRMKVKTLDTPQERKRFKEENMKQIREDDRKGMPSEKQQQNDRKGRSAEKQQEMRQDRQPPQDQRNMERQQKGGGARPPDLGEPVQKRKMPDSKEPVQERQMQQDPRARVPEHLISVNSRKKSSRRCGRTDNRPRTRGTWSVSKRAEVQGLPT